MLDMDLKLIGNIQLREVKISSAQFCALKRFQNTTLGSDILWPFPTNLNSRYEFIVSSPYPNILRYGNAWIMSSYQNPKFLLLIYLKMSLSQQIQDA